MQMSLLGLENNSTSPNRFLAPMLITALFVCVVLVQRPRLLTLSRWRPRWTDLVIGASCGCLVQAVPLFVASIPAAHLYPPSWSRWSILWIAVAGPILEEIFCRGALLKSLKSRLPRFAALALVSVAISAGHHSFWHALPQQAALSFVYLAMGDSLAASITCHITINAFPYLPVAAFFQRWHLFTLWK